MLANQIHRTACATNVTLRFPHSEAERASYVELHKEYDKQHMSLFVLCKWTCFQYYPLFQHIEVGIKYQPS